LARADLLARLRRLDLWLHEGGAGASRPGLAGRRRQPGVEFYDHRPYTPGDDPRHLDWRLLGRLRRPFVRRSEERHEGDLVLAVDTSASMAVAGPAKLTVALELAAALAYLALEQRSRVGLELLGAGGGSLPLGRGQAHLAPLLRMLEGAAAGGRAAPGGRLRAAARHSPTHVVLLSDLLSPVADLHGVARLRALGHHVDLVQILDRHDTDPDLDGPWRLLDGESDAALETRVDPALRAAYRHALAGHLAAIAALARRYRMRYLQLEADAGMERGLHAFLHLPPAP
jgi:uncharacterized protein (DUF58 family)